MRDRGDYFSYLSLPPPPGLFCLLPHREFFLAPSFCDRVAFPVHLNLNIISTTHPHPEWLTVFHRRFSNPGREDREERPRRATTSHAPRTALWQLGVVVSRVDSLWLERWIARSALSPHPVSHEGVKQISAVFVPCRTHRRTRGASLRSCIGKRISIGSTV
jgi:hypothetical protein